MHFKRPLRSLTAWIALCAILLGALAPTLSHAFSLGGDGKRLVPVCTVAGMKMVAVDDSSENGGPDIFPVERCPFCSIQLDTALPPPAPEVVIVLKRVLERFPPLHYRSPRPLFAWAVAHPRAPPSGA